MSSNDSRRDADYSLREEANVRAVRRDAEDDEPIQTVGYVPGSQRARAFPGDDKFPFVKDVPDVTGPDEYRKAAANLQFVNPLPQTLVFGNYDVGQAIDVRGHRGLVLMGIYYPASIGEGEGVGLLSLVAEALLVPYAPTAPDTIPFWIPIGVVDPTLNTPAVAPGFAYRNFYASEFRLDPWVNYQPPFPASGPISFTLVFDVSWYRSVRFRVAERASSQTQFQTFLDLRYFRQR